MEAKPPCVIGKPKQFQLDIKFVAEVRAGNIYTTTAFPRFANAHSKSAGDATPLSVQTQHVDEESINHAFFRSEDLEILHSSTAFATRIY